VQKVRTEWAGHPVGISDDMTVKEVLLRKPDGRRGAGRQKLIWLECCEEDLKSTGVKGWKEKAEERSVWAIIPREELVKL
jgi:uncharacterized protein CbrC (UPF0167 family)